MIRRTLLILALTGAALSRGQTDTSLPGSIQHYSTRITEGDNLHHGWQRPVIKPSDLKSAFSEMAAALKKLETQMADSVLEDRKAIALEFKQLTHPTPSIVWVHKPYVVPLSEARYSSFLKCVPRALAKIKRREQAIRHREPLVAQAIEKELATERGDGWVVTSGIACGAYLGAHGFSVASAQEEVRWLAALTSRSNREEAVELLYYFAQYAEAKRRATEITDFWAYAWPRIAFVAMFSRQPLPTLSTLVDEYVNPASRAVRNLPGGRTLVVENDVETYKGKLLTLAEEQMRAFRQKCEVKL